MPTKRRRRGPEEGEFQDPLKNYDEPDYADELERSLMEETVEQMNITPFKAVPPDEPIENVLKTMAELRIACVLVVENGKLTGILSERDVLMKLAENYDQMKHRPISDVMTANPAFVYRTDSPAKALNIMAVSGFRHVPIVDADNNVVGVLGPRRVSAYLRTHFETAE